jgi:ribosome-binding factor A
MPNEFGRNRRVSKEIQRELAPLVASIASEIRGVMVSVSGVDVASDLRHAVVYISCYGAEAERALQALQAQTGTLRQQLAARLRMKLVPAIRLVADESIERGVRMSALINSLRPTKGSTD